MSVGPANRGEIWTARLGSTAHAVGHEQAKERPVLVVSADFVNHSAAGMVIVLPLTTSERPVRSHVSVYPPEGGISDVSSIQCEQIRAISARRLEQYVGAVSESTMFRVGRTLKFLLDLA